MGAALAHAAHATRESAPRAAPQRTAHTAPERAPGDARGARAGVPLFLQRKVAVGAADTPLERQADAVGDLVMRATVPDEKTEPCAGCGCAGCTGTVQRIPDATTGGTGGTAASASGGALSPSSPVARVLNRPGAGVPLSRSMRRRIEPHVGADLSHVRVHADPSAHVATRSINARAFTHGADIFLGRGESASDARLIGHEATHVVQQGAAPAAAPTVQRDLLDDLGSAATAVGESVGAAATAVGGAASTVAEGVTNLADLDPWSVAEALLPASIVRTLRQIVDRGIVGYLGDMIRGAVARLFAPVQGDGSLVDVVIATVQGLAARARQIVEALASGDCEPMFAAMRGLWVTVQEIAGDVWNAIADFFRPIGDWLSNVWESYGAPVVNWLGQVAGDVWQGIQDMAAMLWNSTQPIRDAVTSAWTWIRNQLGIGEGEEGQNGLLQWVQRKLGDAWAAIRAELAPVIEPVQGIISNVAAILPLGGIQAMREQASQFLQTFGGSVQSFGQPRDAAENQEVLRDQLLPAVLASIEGVRSSLIGAGEWIAGRVASVVSTVTGFLGAVRGTPILGGLAGALGWIETAVTRLGAWVESTVTSALGAVGDALVRLGTFIEPVLNTLRQVVSVVADAVSNLASLVVGFWWGRIPVCIREPIKNFLIEKILRQIPIISTFLDLPDIWTRIQERVMEFLRRVFIDGDLSGAAMVVIRFVLEAVGVDVDLFLRILANAAESLDRIIMDPVGFLTNLFGALTQGMGQFASNILTHLVNGLLGWLIGPLQDMGVRPPRELSLSAILEFVLQILGVSADLIWRKLEETVTERMGAGAGRAVATARRWLDEAWQWIQALMQGGIGGLWQEIQTRISDLWEVVIGGITRWISLEVVESGVRWLANLSQPVGWVIEAIRVIYDVLTFFVNRINQILGMVDAVVGSIGEIARGALSAAANWIEEAMARTLPTVLAFLASLIGISDPAPSIRGIVTAIRERVDAALDWLIERALDVVQGIAGALGRGAVEESGDIRQRAQRAVLTQLRAEHSLEESRDIVAGIQGTMRADGLESLEIGPRDDTGAYTVFVTASPRVPVARLRPFTRDERRAQASARSGRGVRSAIELTLSSAEPATRLEDRQVSVVADRSGRTVTGTMRDVVAESELIAVGTQAQAIPAARQREAGGTHFVTWGERSAGVAVVVPPPGATHVQVRAWNTGGMDPNERGNDTHAEHQFVAWMLRRIRESDLGERVARIEIHNHQFSPCSICASELADLLGAFSPRPSAVITWSAPYVSEPDFRRPLETTQQSLDRMGAAGWSARGPGFDDVAGAPAAPPAESDTELTAEPVPL